MKNIYSLLIGFTFSIFGLTAVAQPSITTYDPAQNATDVAVDKTLVLTFDEDIQFNTSGFYRLIIYKSDDSKVQTFYIDDGSITGDLSISGAQLSLNPDNDLDGSTTYYIKIDANAIQAVSDGSNFGGISSDTEWRFSTISANIPPAIQTYDPIQDATDVNIDKILTLTFDQNIQFNSSGLYKVTVYKDDNSKFQTFYIDDGTVTGGLTISGSQLIINTSNDFDYNTTYYVTISSDAIQASDDGTNFEGISSSTQWRFSTTASSSPPSILTYDPTQNNTNVSPDKTLTLTFNEAIQFNPSGLYRVILYRNDDVKIQTFYIDDGDPAAGLTISGDQLIIDPSSDLVFETSYYILIDDDGIVSSSSGIGFEGLSNSTDWAFTIKPKPLQSLDPDNGSTEVSRTPTLTATFSDNIAFVDNAKISIFKTADHSDYFQLNVGEGALHDGKDSRLTISGNHFSIDLSNTVLDGNTEYGVYVVTDKLSVAGVFYNGFSDIDNPGWAFTTSTNLPTPEVKVYSPEQNATGVSIKNDLSLTFDMKIVPGQGYVKLFKSGDATPVVSCQVDGSIEPNKGVSILNDTILIINPPNDLEINTDYYVTIDQGTFKSEYDEPYEGIDNSNTTWQFHTETPPVITNFDPEDGATEVAIDKVITLTFDKNITPSPTDDWLYIKILDSEGGEFLSIKSRNGELEAGKGASITNNVLTIDAPSSFSASETYTVTIDYGAIRGTDGSNYQGINDDSGISYSFSTVTNPPAIVSLFPANDAIEIGLDSILNIKFNKAIAPNSTGTNQYIYIYKSSDLGNAIYSCIASDDVFEKSDDVYIANDSTLTIDYPGTFEINTEYFVKITNGAIEASLTGDPFGGIDNTESNYWRFTTIAPPEWADNYPRIANQTESNLDILGQTQKDGNFHYVITKSTTAPSVSQIVAGKDENDANALRSGNGAMTSNTEFSSSVDISGLDISTNYYIYIVSIDDIYSLESTVEQLQFMPDEENQWLGTVSSSITEPSNWSKGGFLTNQSIYIKDSISNYPVIGSNLTIKNLKIEPGARLTVNDGYTLKVNGSIDLYSDTAINASILNYDDINVNADSVRVHQVVTSSTNYYYIGSPVSGAYANEIGADIGIYYWDNPQGRWIAESGTNSLEAIKGYVVKSNNNELLFKGSLHNGSYSNTLTRSDAGKGWNLVCNPYPSSIDWDSDGFTKTNIVDGFWIYLNDQNLYGVYSKATQTGVNINNTYIPSNHAFWVKVIEGDDITSGTISFTNAVRVHNNVSYLKSTNTSTYPTLKIVGVNGTNKDEIAIVFADEATSGKDVYDFEKKLSSNENLIQFFTKADDSNIAINGLPPYQNDLIVPLSFKVSNGGDFSIERVEYINFPDDNTVILEDKSTGTMIDLTADKTYSFHVDAAGTYDDRFELTFKGELATGIKEEKSLNNSDIKIYGYEKRIIIHPNIKETLNYQIIDINGRIIKEGKAYPNTNNSTEISKNGIYIVRVISKNRIYSQKVVLY